MISRYMFQSHDESEETALRFQTPPTETTHLALEHLNKELQSLRQVVVKNDERTSKEISGLEDRVGRTEERVEDTDARLVTLETTVEKEHQLNVETFADQLERQDFSSNQAKSHCVLITGTK
jgi:hypothetical protein